MEANAPRRSILTCALVLALAIGPGAALAHQMFLIVPSHHLPADAEVTVALYNGTYDTSENVIDRDRMIETADHAGLFITGIGEAD